jgi:type IV pilus assembly protein PilM
MPDVSVWYTGVQPLIAEAQQSKSSIKAAGNAAPADGAAAGESPAEGDAPVDGAVAAAEGQDPTTEPAADPNAADPNALADDGSGAAAEVAAPSGPGWIIQLKGYHFHNTFPGKPELVSPNDEGKEFIENTFCQALTNGSVQLPDGPENSLVDVPIQKLGIQFPVVTTENPIIPVPFLPEAVEDGSGGPRMGGGEMIGRRGSSATGETMPAGPKVWKLRRYDFTIQFLWIQTPRSARQEQPAAGADGDTLETVSVGDDAGPQG